MVYKQIKLKIIYSFTYILNEPEKHWT